MRLIALLFILATIPIGTSANEMSPGRLRVMEALEDRPLVCADFEQSKILQVLDRPLVSQGRMVFRRGHGVIWRVVEPFPAVVTLRKSSMVRWDGSGKAQVLNYNASPVFGALAGTLMAIVSGDLETLEDAFEVTPRTIGKVDWEVVLNPREPQLARLLAGVRISGGDFAREIDIEEASGDRTRLVFNNVTFETCHVTASEETYFEE